MTDKGPTKCDKCGTFNGPGFLITQFLVRVTLVLAPLTYLVLAADRTNWATVLGMGGVGLFGLGMTLTVLRAVARGNK